MSEFRVCAKHQRPHTELPYLHKDGEDDKPDKPEHGCLECWVDSVKDTPGICQGCLYALLVNHVLPHIHNRDHTS